MSKPLFKPPKHLVQEWPEVFEDLYMNTMPIHYLEMIRLEFDNGRVWEIDVREQLEVADGDAIANKLIDTFQEYRDDIKKMDFKIDIEKLKKDIQDQTKGLFD
jgi:hypothetical protein